MLGERKGANWVTVGQGVCWKEISHSSYNLSEATSQAESKKQWPNGHTLNLIA